MIWVLAVLVLLLIGAVVTLWQNVERMRDELDELHDVDRSIDMLEQQARDTANDLPRPQ